MSSGDETRSLRHETWWLHVALVTAACGRIGFLGTSGDGSGAGAGAKDGGVVGTADAFAPWDVVPISACGATIIVSDDFTTTAPGAQWMVTQSADSPITQGAGALRITFTSPTQSVATSTYALSSSVSFANACATIELGQVPNASTSASAIFTIGTVNVNVRFLIVAGNLQSICAQSSNNVNHLDVRPYDPSAHRFLRLSQASNTWSWQVSADGTTFTTVATNTCSTVPTTNVLGLIASANQGTSDAGGVTFGTVAVSK